MLVRSVTGTTSPLSLLQDDRGDALRPLEAAVVVAGLRLSDLRLRLRGRVVSLAVDVDVDQDRLLAHWFVTPQTATGARRTPPCR